MSSVPPVLPFGDPSLAGSQLLPSQSAAPPSSPAPPQVPAPPAAPTWRDLPPQPPYGPVYPPNTPNIRRREADPAAVPGDASRITPTQIAIASGVTLVLIALGIGVALLLLGGDDEVAETPRATESDAPPPEDDPVVRGELTPMPDSPQPGQTMVPEDSPGPAAPPGPQAPDQPEPPNGEQPEPEQTFPEEPGPGPTGQLPDEGPDQAPDDAPGAPDAPDPQLPDEAPDGGSLELPRIFTLSTLPTDTVEMSTTVRQTSSDDEPVEAEQITTLSHPDGEIGVRASQGEDMSARFDELIGEGAEEVTVRGMTAYLLEGQRLVWLVAADDSPSGIDTLLEIDPPATVATDDLFTIAQGLELE